MKLFYVTLKHHLQKMCESDAETMAKRQKLSNETDRNIDTNIESPIFKLNDDCFGEIFEYLSVREVYAFGQTCKKLCQLAGDYFKCNHSAAFKFSGDNGIYTEFSDNNGAINQRTQTSGFNKFITQISHYYERMAPLYYIQSHSIEFESIVQINFVCVPIDEIRIKCIRRILNQIQLLQLKNCSVDGDLYHTILKYCDNLKQLYIQDSDIGHYRCRQYQPKYDWLLQRYPKLEYLEKISSYTNYWKELNCFLSNNQNVKIFSTNQKFMWKNRMKLLESTVQLDVLKVKVDRLSQHYSQNDAGNEKFRSICNLLQQLQDRQFYKRLHLYVCCMNQQNFAQLTSLHSLEKLCIKYVDESVHLSQLANMKELVIFNIVNAACMENIAKSMPNLQHLILQNAKFDDLLPFIRYSNKLSKIKFVPTDNKHILKLFKLNETLLKLLRRRKITIYVPDNIFLRTKWTIRNGNTSLSLLEMKRSNSYQWEQFF